MMKEKRNRKRMGFWIDYGKDEDLLVSETIDTLKGMRKYQRAILQGIQLIASLWEGRVDVLLTMFPWVADTIISQSTPPTDDINELKRMIEQLSKQVNEQGRAIPDTRDGGFPAMMPATQAAKPAALPPTVQPKAAPVADAGAIADNFLAFIQ